MDSQPLSQGGVGNSIDITCHLSYKTAMDKGILLGLVGHQDHRLETERMAFPRPQRRHPSI